MVPEVSLPAAICPIKAFFNGIDSKLEYIQNKLMKLKKNWLRSTQLQLKFQICCKKMKNNRNNLRQRLNRPNTNLVKLYYE